MGRYSVRQLCAFILACGVYFGGLPQMFFLGLRGAGADSLAAFAGEAVLAWLLIAAVYAYLRQWTPLALHCLCVVLSVPLMIVQLDVGVQTEHVPLVALGRGCWAATLISFPISLGLLAVLRLMDRRVDPLSRRLSRGAAVPGEPSVPRSPNGVVNA